MNGMSVSFFVFVLVYIHILKKKRKKVYIHILISFMNGTSVSYHMYSEVGYVNVNSLLPETLWAGS